MANTMYNSGKTAIFSTLNLLTADIKCALVDLDDYTPNFATHAVLNDVPGAAIVATSGNLAGKTVTSGVFDANDFSFPGVSGDQSEALLYYHDTGNPLTSTLLCLCDTATGLAVTPDGNNINVTIGSHIFAMGTPAP